MPSQVVFTPNPIGLYNVLNSPLGITGRYILKQAGEVAVLARADAPRVTGTLANSIVVASLSLAGNPAATVTATAPYSLYVHEGTRPHPIDPVNAKVLRFPNKAGMIVFAAHVDHPGTQPNPFLVRAMTAVIGS